MSAHRGAKEQIPGNGRRKDGGVAVVSKTPLAAEDGEEEEEWERAAAVVVRAASESLLPEDSTDLVTHAETSSLQRGLHQRHVSLIAIAGSIGTGLFLGLGASIQTGGPLGALLGYLTVGLIVCAVQFALGEVTALLPVTGSFVRHSEFLLDPAWGFAVGWNIVYGNWLSIPAEISAICVLFQYWTDVNISLWIVLAILLTFLVGISLIRVYGDTLPFLFFPCPSI